MKFLILLLCAGYVFGNEVWDELIDQAIDAAREEIIEKKFDTINIPDVNEEFKEEIFGIPFTLSVKSQGSQFWNVSTVSRRREVDVYQDDETGNVTIVSALGIDDFFLSCNNLNVKVFGLHLSGTLYTQCKSNEMEFSLSLITSKEDDKCTAELNWVRITSFNNFNVNIQPSGLINWLAQHISSMVLNDFSSHVIAAINMNLKPAINAALSKIDVCELIPI